ASDGSRETPLCQCGSVCGSGVLDARLPRRVEYSSVRSIACGWVVRACDRATRSQSAHSSAFTLRWAPIAPLSRLRVTRRVDRRLESRTGKKLSAPSGPTWHSPRRSTLTQAMVERVILNALQENGGPAASRMPDQ